MKTHRILLILLLTLIANPTAYASICQLNIKGDKICVNQKALRKVVINRDEAESSRRQNEVIFIAVVVKEMDYPEAIIDQDGKKIRVSVDDLVGKQSCENGDFVCENDRVKLDEECAPASRDKYKIEEVYRNEMVEVQTGGFWIFKKATSHVLPLDCIDQVIED